MKCYIIKKRFQFHKKQFMGLLLAAILMLADMPILQVSAAESGISNAIVMQTQSDVSGNDEELVGDTNPEQDETDEQEYTITYELGGGTNSEKNPATYTSATPTITLEAATRKGYTFSGWYSDKEHTKIVVEISKGSSGDIVLYAGWDANQYTIKFMKNGAKSGEMTAMSACRYDTVYTLRENAFVRSGYTFTGWNTKADGTGHGYYDQEKVQNLCENEGDVIELYAQWEKTKYTITYVLNGGKNSSKNPAYYYSNTKTFTLQSPTRKGYTFEGWYQTKKFKNKITKIKKGSNKNYKIYAKWKANKYSVMYYGNGATTGSMSASNVSYDQTFKLRKNAYKRDGYTFGGWNTKKDGSGTSYKNKQSVKNLTTKSGKVVKLYAQWNKVCYTINYHLNGGTNHKKNPTSYETSQSAIALQNPTKEGYLFLGWFTDEACTNRITEIAAGTYGNLDLYAKWGLENYTIEFSANGGTGKVDNLNCKSGTNYKLPVTGYIRSGYVCIGWNTASDGSGTKYDFCQEVTNLTDGATITLYAQWRQMTTTELNYATEVITKVNTARKNAGASELKEDSTLTAIAGQRAYEISLSWSHDRPDGTSYTSLYNSVSYTYTTGGENIASGYSSAENVMSAWMNSASHKSNILSTSYTKIGVGCIYLDGKYYWVQNFSG